MATSRVTACTHFLYNEIGMIFIIFNFFMFLPITVHTWHEDYTGKHNFCCMQTICVSYVFFRAEFKYVTRIALSPTVFV